MIVYGDWNGAVYHYTYCDPSLDNYHPDIIFEVVSSLSPFDPCGHGMLGIIPVVSPGIESTQ